MQRSVFLPIVFLICFVPARAETYLVLPFFNLSNDHNLDWIGESLSESVREALASDGVVTLDRDERVEAMRRLSIKPYALLTRASVVKIGEELDAEHVVYGQFELKPSPDPGAKSRGSLEIAAHILDLKGLNRGPVFQESGVLEDLARLQRRVAWETLRFAAPKLAPPESEFQTRHPAVRVDAIESYVRGLLATNADEKHKLFTQAVRLDPRYTQPCFELGRLHWRKKEYKSAEDWFQKVAPSDDHYREARFFLGLSRYYAGNFAGAEEAFQTVALIVPLNEVYNNLGAAESRRNLPDALDSFRKAMDGDVSDPTYQFNVGYALWKKGDFPGAAERFRAVLQTDPNDKDANLLLARCQQQSGPRPTDTRTDGLERLKTDYEETAYWQLKAVLQPEKP